MCDFSKLFWKVGDKGDCSGYVEKIGHLNKNVDQTLANNSCQSDHYPVSEAILLLSQVSPCAISLDVLSDVEICQSHLVSFTFGRVQHLDNVINILNFQ